MKFNLLAILFLLPGVLGAAKIEVDHSDERRVQRTFACSEKTELEITNMYGDVEITNWEKDSVRIEVTITAFSEDLGDLREMLEDIEIEFSNNSSFIVVESQWSDEMGTLRKSWYDLKQNFGGGNRIPVNMEIAMPSYLDLEIENKFGDVFLENQEGDLEVDISHGDFRAHDIMKAGEIKLSYGRLDIHELKEGRLDLSYCRNARVDEAGEVILEMNSSELQLEKADKVRINSRHDEVRIEEVNEITGTLNLTDIVVEEVKELVDVSTRMGDLELREVSPSCRSISVSSNMTDIELGLEMGFNGALQFELENVKDFSIPIPEVEMTSNQKDEKTVLMTGNLGDAESSKVEVDAKGGYIRVYSNEF